MGRKAFYFALTFLLIVLLLVSCSDKTDEELVGLKINISFGEGRGIMLGSEAPNRESIIWTYKLTKHDKGMTWGEGDEALLNGTLKVSQGVWWVDIWGYRDSECREVVYAGGGEGNVGPEGGILSVTVSTITDPSKAKSLDPSKEPKSTAELVLGNLVTEKDVQLDLAKYVSWRVDGKEIERWNVNAGEETFGNIQGHIYTKEGVLVTDDTEVVVEVPSGIHDIQVLVITEKNEVISSMLWEKKALEMNCAHKISGVLPVKYVDYLDFFDINPSWENVGDDQIIIGYAYNVNDNQPMIKEYPIPVYVDKLKEKYTSDELNLRSVVINSEEKISPISKSAWIGKEAKLFYEDSLGRVSFSPSATSIKYEQMNYCIGVDEVIVPEGIRDIQYHGISAKTGAVIELPASLDYISVAGLSSKSYAKIIFKNPNGWMIGDEAIDSEVLSDPVTAATFYYERGGNYWRRVQDERDCVAEIKNNSWVESGLSSPLEDYRCYQTQMEKSPYSNAYIRIVFLNDGNHTIYIRHDSPYEDDYISASEVNSSTSTYKCTTASFDNSLDAYDSVTYEGVKAGDYCSIEFRTYGGSSVDHGEGYVLIQDKVKVV